MQGRQHPTVPVQANLENSPLLEKAQFQENADFVYRQWRLTNVDGWQTFILDVGEGTPMIVVPIAQGLEAFDSLLLQHFAQKYRVITYQRREDENQILDRANRARDLQRILHHLGIEQAHFVSHSSGSVATTTLALECPSLFRSYVWMNLSPRAAMNMTWWRKKLADSIHYIPLSDHMIASLMASSTSGGNRSCLLYDRTYEQFMAIKRTAGVRSMKRWFERNVWTLAKYDWSTGLDRLTMPILPMNSDNDIVNTAATMSQLQSQLPNNYGYKIVKGGLHFFHYLCADQVINYMEAFYRELGKQSRSDN